MKANYEDKIQKQETQVEMGNLYDMNKQLMMKEPAISEERLTAQKALLKDWVNSYSTQHYFMLLCNERRDYTIFNLQPKAALGFTIGQIDAMTNDVIECMMNRGTLIALDLQPDNVWELWLRVDNECFAYYLFPYGEAVLEY